MAAGRLQQFIKQLPRRSRDHRLLVKAALALVGGGCLIGLVLSLILAPQGPERDAEFDTGALLSAWRETLESAGFGTRTRIVRTGGRPAAVFGGPDCRMIRPGAPGNEAALQAALAFPEDDPLSREQRQLLLALAQGLRPESDEARDEAAARLLSLPTALPYRNEFLGDLRYAAGDPAAALAHYREEAERGPPTEATLYARRSAVVAASRARSQEAFGELLAQPRYRDAFSSSERLVLLAGMRDYLGLAGAVAAHELKSLASPVLVPALLCAAIWAAILLRFWNVTRPRLLAAFLAFLAGILSAGLTLYAVLVQEEVQGFSHRPEDTPLAQFIYFLAGVALREETLKLLCAVPFAIYAARRRSEVEGMLLPAFVGLGFAFQENIAYLEGGLSTYIAWVRFLSANVLHFALTGMAGYYLYRMIVRRFHGIEDFLFAFVAVVFIHGVYNSVLAIPTLHEYAILSTILVALIAYRYFDPLRSAMDVAGLRHRISPLGLFVVGSAFLLALVVVAASALMPYAEALSTLATAFGGMVPLAFAFMSRFRDL